MLIYDAHQQKQNGVIVKRLFAVLAALLLLGACASPQQNAQWSADAARPVTCAAGSDCEMKWSRALNWVQDNSHWKIRSESDNLITTEGPFDSVDAAFSITKSPVGDGTYALLFRAGCGNMFGCVPSILELKASFVNQVMGPATMSPPAAMSPELRFGSRLKFGVRMLTVTPQAVETLSLTATHGALVIDVAAGSPAANAGIVKGDVITSVSGNAIVSAHEVQSAVEPLSAGANLPVTFQRGAASQSVTVRF